MSSLAQWREAMPRLTAEQGKHHGMVCAGEEYLLQEGMQKALEAAVSEGGENENT